MTAVGSAVDLSALAGRIAAELARADESKRAPGTIPVVMTPSRAALTEPAGSVAHVLSSPPGVAFTREQSRIADYIDHTVLKPETTRQEIEQLCAEAAEHGFAAVCVNPVWVPLCAALLKSGGVKIATVIGFPLGCNQSAIKAAEARLAVEQGADELDMVAALGQIKSGDWGAVAGDIAAVVKASQGRLVKVILESATLTPVEIIKATALAREAGAQYVKTSTGFHAAGGASAEAVALMRLVVGDSMGVKASGGVRDCGTALKMIGSGATRIGTSSGVAMAKCLGPGPLPLRELLASPSAHAGRCSTGACQDDAAVPATKQY